ncbi:MAG: pyridoxamine 5'-phosphate oxidase family protein [Ectothiorhodospiraceae bacterium]
MKTMSAQPGPEWLDANRFDEVITDQRRLREIVKPPSRYVAHKVIDHIDGLCRRFIAAAPFAVIGSTGTSATVDLSPKGDAPGFVKVLDPHTLAIPDRLGNNRADTLCNLLEDDRLGLIFLVPGKRETLRVGGRAAIVRDARLSRRLAHNGREPNLAIVVRVSRAYFHCAKCMIRAGLWEPDSWPDASALPSLAETMVRHGKLPDPVEEVQEIVRRDAENRLY